MCKYELVRSIITFVIIFIMLDLQQWKAPFKKHKISKVPVYRVRGFSKRKKTLCLLSISVAMFM